MPTTAGYRNDAAHEDEGEELAEVVAGAEKPVVSAALAQGIPARQGDDRRRRAHRLRPSVDAPHYGEGDEERHVAYHARAIGEAQRPDQQVGDGRDAESRSHETLDVAVVGDESVDEFADGVGEQQRRADDAQLCGVERPAFEDRFLDHIQARATDVIKAIADRTGDEALEAELLVKFHKRFVIAPERSRRPAFTEEREWVHSVVCRWFFGIQNYSIKRHK